MILDENLKNNLRLIICILLVVFGASIISAGTFWDRWTDKGIKVIGNCLEISGTKISSISNKDLPKILNPAEIEIVKITNTSIQSLPDDIFSEFTNINTVIISGNSKFMPTLTMFSALNGLKDINFSNNNFGEKELPDLSKLRITNLNLSGNGLKSIPNLPTTLTELIIRDNELSSNFCQNELPDLQFLDISNNKITNLDTAKYPKLKYLFASSNKGFSLDFSQNPLSQIDFIDVTNCGIQQIDSNVLNISMPNVRIIVANQNPLRDNKFNFTGLSNLEELYLDRCNISNIDNKFGLQKLKRLSLGGNIIETVPANFLNTLPELTSLYLFSNKITKIWGNFLVSAKLKTLDLSYNYISIVTKKLSEGIPNLKSLALQFNCIKFFEKFCFIHLNHLNLINVQNNGYMELNDLINDPTIFANANIVLYKGNKPIQYILSHNGMNIAGGSLIVLGAFCVFMAPLPGLLYLIPWTLGGLAMMNMATAIKLKDYAVEKIRGEPVFQFAYLSDASWPVVSMRLIRLENIDEYLRAFRAEYKKGLINKPMIGVKKIWEKQSKSLVPEKKVAK